MVKILGYDDREIAFLYLVTTGIVVLITEVIAIYLGYLMMGAFWKYMMMSLGGWFAFVMKPSGFVKEFVLVLIAYLIITILDFIRIRKIPKVLALKNKEIENGLRFCKPDISIIKEIYAIGLPAIIAQTLMSLMTYGLNVILVRISTSMQTAYGLYYKIQQFILFAAFGLRDAITPIVAFSHGLGNKNRIREGIKYGLVFTECIMFAGLLLIEVFAVPFSGIFGVDGDTLKLFISAMRIASISFIFAGANIAFQGIYQALDGGMESLVVSLCRQLILVFPPVLLFAHMAIRNTDAAWLVWTAFPIAECLTMLIGIILLKRLYCNKISGDMRLQSNQSVAEIN